MTTRPDLHTPRGRRALIIDMARRRQRPGTGSLLRALMEDNPVTRWPDLREVLAPLPWGVIGAVATRLYMPERATHDLDIMVMTSDLREAESRLAQAGWQREGELTVGGSSWRLPEGARLDVLACDEPWCPEALAEAESNRDQQGLPVLPLPYLVLTKLRSSRTIDLGDLPRMLGLADEVALDRVRAVVRKYSPEDAEDLESLIELGKLETKGA